ncbi:YihD family protein [Shewanella gelidii]|uniref:DUF1040 family protein n=1 Tax=Shewanella gelidii TaxID=1642821 RepID=A0A917NA83_9GAMM|nr:YihD family protein [Shewanella gelidii]MCL1098451.1 YihD family protein [Shewanella gelidii]GGI82658.1 hypothetical protein GCM10009332_19860 [Shewanella gelidii]
MHTHRVNELIELLQEEWLKEPEINLVDFLQKLAEEAKFSGKLEELNDDVLFYHLKMRNSAEDELIPGIAKDYEEDFKTAILRARGMLDE